MAALQKEIEAQAASKSPGSSEALVKLQQRILELRRTQERRMQELTKPSKGL